MITEEMERAIEISFVTKDDWLILFLKEGEERIPVIQSGWDEDVVSGTFMCFGVVTCDARNGGHIARWLETLRGLHHAS